MGQDGPGESGAARTVERPTSLPPELAHRTGFALYRLAMFAQEVLDRGLAPLGLRSRHYQVLGVLALRGPLPQGVVADRLRIDRAMMVRLVDELEGRGLVERRRDPADRRPYLLTLTEAGGRAATAGDAAAAEMEDVVFGPLSPGQRAELRALLSRLFRQGEELPPDSSDLTAR